MSNFLQEFVVEIFRQLFGWNKPREGKLQPVPHDLSPMLRVV